MRTEDPVQFKEYRVSAVFGGQIAPAVFVVYAKAQKFTEVVREVGRQAASLQ